MFRLRFYFFTFFRLSEFFEAESKFHDNDDNSCLVNVHYDPVWPLVCDPNGGFCEWFASENKNAQIILHEVCLVF